ncbi:hypothetical protein [Emticicia sp.]|uniref:hypothetical protein n=1 Tax=Emticicia sp. TaxID=1930953 RepID=UPI003751B342
MTGLYQHILAHNCAIITSFRNSDEKSDQENFETNSDLKAYLLNKRYGLTSVTGSYIEDYNTELAKEVREGSYFVVSLYDDDNFKNNIKKLGKHYNQDDVILIDKGGQSAYLYRINNAGFQGHNKISLRGKFLPKEEAELMTTVGKSKSPITISNKSLPKENEIGLLETLKNYQINGKWAISSIAKRVEKSIAK